MIGTSAAPQESLLKPGCGFCGANSDLYASVCRHMTLCAGCGKTMAESGSPCPHCRQPLKGLVREFNVKAHPLNKPHFVGRFLQGLPSFSKKKSGDLKWSMQREGLQGRQLTDALREKYKSKPWLLQDDQGQQSFQGALEGGQQASYYLLMMHGKDFLAIPAGSWYNFHKVANYKQLTLEEAEEQMKNRRKTADGYQRWLMKAASNGAAAFGEVEKVTGGGGGGGGRGGFRRSADDDDDGGNSDKGEEDADEDVDRKERLGLNKKGGDEDEEAPAKADDNDFEDEEKGDDWEHEETFTDDDEAVAVDPEEREDQGPDIPAPPEIKQEEEDEEGEKEDGEQEKGGLSESGLELKKLLGKSAMDESDDDFSDDDGDEDNTSPVLAPKKKEVKEEPVESTPMKPANSAAGTTTPATTTASKGKRKAGSDDLKAGGSTKKVKTEEDVKPVKKENVGSSSTSSATKAAASGKSSGSAAQGKSSSQPTTGVTEEDIKAVLRQGPIKSQDLVNKFRSRLVSADDKTKFAAALKNISRIHKTNAGNFIVLREK